MDVMGGVYPHCSSCTRGVSLPGDDYEKARPSPGKNRKRAEKSWRVTAGTGEQAHGGTVGSGVGTALPLQG